MKKTTYREDLLRRLKDTDYALGYLNDCVDDEDPGMLLLALKDVAEAHGGIGKIAKKAGLNREHLFKMLSQKGNPRLESIRQITNVFGIRIMFAPLKKQKLNSRHSFAKAA